MTSKAEPRNQQYYQNRAVVCQKIACFAPAHLGDLVGASFGNAVQCYCGTRVVLEAILGEAVCDRPFRR